MLITTALSMRDSYRQDVRDTYSQARMCGHSHAVMLDEFSKLRLKYFKCPNWVHSYIDGYKQALNESLYANDLVFGGFIGETFYSTHNNRADYYGKHHEPALWTLKARDVGHYWDRGNGKVSVYFIG